MSKTALHYRCEFWPQNITAKKPSVTSDKIIAGVAPASGKYSSKMCINTLLDATSASNQQQLSYIGQRLFINSHACRFRCATVPRIVTKRMKTSVGRNVYNIK